MIYMIFFALRSTLSVMLMHRIGTTFVGNVRNYKALGFGGGDDADADC